MQLKYAYRGAAFFFAVFERVIDQVYQHLSYFFAVRIYQDRIIIFLLKYKLDVMLTSLKFQRFKHLFDQVIYFKLTVIDRHLARFQFVYLIQIFDQVALSLITISE